MDSSHASDVNMRCHNWHPGHIVESNSVSGVFLQKTATMPKMGGDFRHSGPNKYQIRDQRLFA
jgi:hypothetical protein